MTRILRNKLVKPFDEPEQAFHSLKKLFKTPSLDHSNPPGFKLFSDKEDQFEEEITETMGEPTMEEYMTKTREDYGSGIARPKFDKDAKFELKGRFKELRDNTFNVTQDQLMLRIFPITLTGTASRWIRNEPMEEINNFQQEPDETLYQAWEQFKEILLRCPQNYLNSMQEVILYYKGLDVPTRQILDSKVAVPKMNAADAKKAIQEMADHS
ncbi:hypothetical protein Tco_0533402 [Tanacetum coccineum]